MEQETESKARTERVDGEEDTWRIYEYNDAGNTIRMTGYFNDGTAVIKTFNDDSTVVIETYNNDGSVVVENYRIDSNGRWVELTS